MASVLLLGACCGPGFTDGGSGGTGGEQSYVGSCDDAGACPSDAYCLPSFKQCYDQVGVSVRTAPGNCYLSDPCGSDCSSTSCTSDLDCGESLQCSPSGTCCDASQGTCPGAFGGTGGTTTPQCPGPVPSPCPQGCTLVAPPHECQTCLCQSCPPLPDAGVDGG
ncbi:MAG: hypothetical protein ACYDCL_19435 [Myxococcales bacterium]